MTNTTLRTFAAAGATAAVALLWAGSGTATSTGCTAGVTKYGGATARVFCGPATATVHAGGKTFTIRQGSCERGPKYLSINIGEVILGTSRKPKPDYFGLDIGKVPYVGGIAVTRDGTYHSAVVAVAHAGRGYSLRAQASVTLTNNRTRGTFSGTLLTGGVATGSFRC